ncbi:3633_t:CDS:1, partial [Funneliformis caledonium]
YGHGSEIASICFVDILSLKMYVNNPLHTSLISDFTLNTINSTFDLYKQGMKYKNLRAFSSTSTSIDRLINKLVS